MAGPRKPGQFGRITAQDRERMRLMDADGEWLDHLPPAEIEKLAGKYVAVKDKQVVASSRSMAALASRLRRLKLRFVSIRRIEEPTVVVYRWNS